MQLTLNKYIVAFKIIQVGNRKICISGVGKMFYEQGFPISISVKKLKEKGIEVSILHVADECLKNGWSPKTTIAKLSEECVDSMETASDIREVEIFCNATYVEQREMIFKSLYKITSNEAIKNHKQFIENYKNNTHEQGNP